MKLIVVLLCEFLLPWQYNLIGSLVVLFLL